MLKILFISCYLNYKGNEANWIALKFLSTKIEKMPDKYRNVFLCNLEFILKNFEVLAF